MPKAVITTKSGATVSIEGTHDEVVGLVAWLEGSERSVGRLPAHRPTPQQGKSRPTPMALLSELIATGFFSEPKELGTVRLALEEQGHFYPVTTLSPLMLRLVRKRELRRIKGKKRWLYVV
jgi:hypothetical protein